MKKSTLSLALLILINFVSFSQWTQSLGLDGGELHDVVVIDSLMFTVSPEGYIYSRTENEAWQINYDQGKFNRICKVGDCIIAYDVKDDNHAIRSFDAGQSWEIIEQLDPSSIIVTDSVFFINGWLYSRSFDYGDSYDTIAIPIHQYHDKTLFSDGNKLYLLIEDIDSENYLYESNDYGDSWGQINCDSLKIRCPVSVKITEIDDNLWMIINNVCPGDYNGANSTIYYFNENLNYWVNINYNLPEPCHIKDLSEFNDKVYLALDNHNVFRFNENDSLWENFSDASHNPNKFLEFNDQLFAACDQGLCSIDSLGNWINYYEGFSNRDITSIDVLDDKIYLAANNEIFVSDDHAVSFIKMDNIYGVDIKTTDSLFYVAAPHEFFISEDYGDSWQSYSEGLSDEYKKTNKTLAVSNDYYYLTTFDGLYRTANNPVNWSVVDGNYDFKHGNFYQVETIGNSVLVNGYFPTYYMYYSIDNGNSFEGFIETTPITAIGEEFYYFTDSIFYSNDPSQEWLNLPFTNKQIYGFDRVEDTMVAIGQNIQTPFIDLSYDRGESWESIRNDLPSLIDVKFYESKVKIWDNLILFDNTNLGLWYRNDLLTGKKENSITKTNKLHVTVSPNPFVNSTKISFNLDEKSEVNIQIIKVNGEVVESRSSIENSGKYEFCWNVTSFPSGIYYYRIIIENEEVTGKLVHIK